jgi:hypothetical protein
MQTSYKRCWSTSNFIKIRPILGPDLRFPVLSVLNKFQVANPVPKNANPNPENHLIVPDRL